MPLFCIVHTSSLADTQGSISGVKLMEGGVCRWNDDEAYCATRSVAQKCLLSLLAEDEHGFYEEGLSILELALPSGLTTVWAGMVGCEDGGYFVPPTSTRAKALKKASDVHKMVSRKGDGGCDCTDDLDDLLVEDIGEFKCSWMWRIDEIRVLTEGDFP